MTKAQYNKRIKEYVTSVTLNLLAKANSVWISGAINAEEYGDDWQLPKIVMKAALLSESNGIRLSSEKECDEFDNLEHFV